jgi:hypothetical protein
MPNFNPPGTLGRLLYDVGVAGELDRRRREQEQKQKAELERQRLAGKSPAKRPLFPKKPR